MQIRIKFNKEGYAAYISHLDLLRTFNRMIKRSGIIPEYSKGYNPHSLMTFLQPSSVGMVSKNDYAELKIADGYDINTILELLEQNAPPGIGIISVTEDVLPSFSNLDSAKYKVLIKCNKNISDMENVLEKENILIDKKTKKGIKEVDIKPLIINYEFSNEDDFVVIKLHLKCGSVLNLNPSLIIKAFEKYIEEYSIDELKIIRECMLTDTGEIY